MNWQPKKTVIFSMNRFGVQQTSKPLTQPDECGLYIHIDEVMDMLNKIKTEKKKAPTLFVED